MGDILVLCIYTISLSKLWEKSQNTLSSSKSEWLTQVSLVLVNIYFFYCRICNSTALEMCLNNSKSEDSISKQETDTSETRSNINKVIIFVVYVFVSIMIGIIGFAVYKTLKKKKGNFNLYQNYSPFFYMPLLML